MLRNGKLSNEIDKNCKLHFAKIGGKLSGGGGKINRFAHIDEISRKSDYNCIKAEDFLQMNPMIVSQENMFCLVTVKY